MSYSFLVKAYILVEILFYRYYSIWGTHILRYTFSIKNRKGMTVKKLLHFVETKCVIRCQNDLVICFVCSHFFALPKSNMIRTIGDQNDRENGNENILFFIFENRSRVPSLSDLFSKLSFWWDRSFFQKPFLWKFIATLPLEVLGDERTDWGVYSFLLGSVRLRKL